MQVPWRKTPQGVTMGEMLVATFTGRASPDMAMEVFGHLMQMLRLWGKLESEEHVALHNVALEIIGQMRAGPTLNLKDLSRITMVIEHERPEDAT